MAAKKPARPKDLPAGRALQWGDFDATGQAVIFHNMAGKGMVRSQMGARIQTAKESVATAQESYKDKPDPSGRVRLAERTLTNLQRVEEHTVDKPVTLEGAARRRAGYVRAGAARTRAEGDPVTGRRPDQMSTPTGTGWYFSHHSDIKAAAEQHGFDTKRAITASAVMSPTNSPENEKAAVGALMQAHGKTVHITPEVHAFLQHEAKQGKKGKEGVPVPDDIIGKHVPVAELHPEHVANLSGVGAASDEKKASTRRTLARAAKGSMTTEVDFTQIARGGSKGNIVKAIDVLRGTVPHDKAIDPVSSPKVWSYNNAIHNAVPNTGVHEEYLTRVHHVLSGKEMKGQQALDLYGLRSSNAGILDPKGHTAEDTWQNTITMGQPNVTIPGTRTLVSKTIASDKSLGLGLSKTAPVGEGGSEVSAHGHPDVKDSALIHAYNNEATGRAAAALSKGTGMRLPAVAAQEIGWTEIRRATGKDPAYNAAQAAKSSLDRQADRSSTVSARQQPTLPINFKGM